jgi:hypothetical protein
MTNLVELSMNRTEITDAGFRHLEDVTSLVALRLAGTNVSPEAVDRLRRALPNLTILIQRETHWLFIKAWGGATEVTVIP